MKNRTVTEMVEAKEAFILFEVAGTSYGIRSQDVQQMEMVESITPVPNTPDFVDGVMFSRGEAIPVINLRRRFGMDRIDYDMRTRVIVVRDNDRITGLIADVAKEYVNLPAGSVHQVPDFVSGTDTKWLDGISRWGDRTILIINIKKLIAAE